MVGGTVDAGITGTEVRSRGGTVTSEVSDVEDESRGTGDTSPDGWVPSSGTITSNAMIQGVEVRGARRTVA